MQVQSSAKHTEIGWQRYVANADLSTYGVSFNGGSQHPYITQIDVAAGFPSENKWVRTAVRSRFMESAYAHDVANRVASSLLSPIDGSAPTYISPQTYASTGNYTTLYGKAH